MRAGRRPAQAPVGSRCAIRFFGGVGAARFHAEQDKPGFPLVVSDPGGDECRADRRVSCFSVGRLQGLGSACQGLLEVGHRLIPLLCSDCQCLEQGRLLRWPDGYPELRGWNQGIGLETIQLPGATGAEEVLDGDDSGMLVETGQGAGLVDKSLKSIGELFVGDTRMALRYRNRSSWDSDCGPRR